MNNETDFALARTGLVLLAGALIVAANDPASGAPAFAMAGVFCGGYLAATFCLAFAEGGVRLLFDAADDGLGRLLGAAFALIGFGCAALFVYAAFTTSRPDLQIAMATGTVLYLNLLRGPLLRLTAGHSGKGRRVRV